MEKDLNKFQFIPSVNDGVSFKQSDEVNTTGTFYYNSAYDYSKIISCLPSTWTAVAV